MLDRDHANDIFDKLRRLSQADEIELLISGGRSALTRFANNTIHQNVAEEEYHISVRSAFGNRTARASTNRHDDDSLRRVVQSSEALAKAQHSDPDLLPMPTQEEVAAAAVDCGDAAVDRYFETTARLTPQDRAQAVAQMVDVAKRHGLTSAGIFSSAEVVEGVFNSKGVSDWYEQTLAEVSISMLDSSSSGWQKANSPDIARLDPARMAEVAAQKAIESRNPRDLSPGKYTVILEPAAVLDIVGFMFWDFGGSALPRTAIVSERSNRDPAFRRQHHRLGRRVPPIAGGCSVRWRSDWATTFEADRERHSPGSDLFAFQRKTHEGI